MNEPRIDVHLDSDTLARSLRIDVAEGLTSTPKSLPPKWFYDEAGATLFDAITQLDAYYPTRREREILEREAATIAAATRADTLIELGSGTSDKTRLLLDAFVGDHDLRRFVPFDVSEQTLRWATHVLAETYPHLQVHGVVGDFDHHLDTLPTGGRRLVAFLGGTIGNFEPASRKRFLADLAEALEPGDGLLLGTDLVKDQGRLVAAYDDPEGVTAAFNRNVLRVLNRELDADFDVDSFGHVAVWDPDEEWIEMRLRSPRDHVVTIRALDLGVDFAAGEELRTEISAKFRRDRVEAELAGAGLELTHWWTDGAGDFALSLSFAR